MCASTCDNLLTEISSTYAIQDPEPYYEVDAGELTDLDFVIYNTYAADFNELTNSVPQAYEISLEEEYDELLISDVRIT